MPPFETFPTTSTSSSRLIDDGKTYFRGPHQYYRPYGWTRCALNVTGKYENDLWLGDDGIRTSTTPGEWSVSYHGTKRENVQGISNKGFLLSKGKAFSAYGIGIYSSPKISIAEGYAPKFKYKGRWYKIVFQNRCNPSDIEAHRNGDYWLTKDEANIRPYGVCFKCIALGNTCTQDNTDWCTIL